MRWQPLVLLVLSATVLGLVAWAQSELTLWWNVKWYRVKSASWWCPETVELHTAPIGTETLPLTFDCDWGEDAVYAGHRDYIGFKAVLTLNLPTPVELIFVVGSDDGARLYIDGKLVINRWRCQSFSKSIYRKRLEAGSHLLELHFFEWRGAARVQFDIFGLELIFALHFARLQSRMDELEKKLVESLKNAGQIARLEQEIRGLAKNISAMEMVLKERALALEKELAETRQQTEGQIVSLREEVKTLAQNIAEMEAMLSSALQSLMESIASVQAHVAEVEENLAGQAEATAAQIASVHEALTILRDSLAVLEQAVGAVEEKQRALVSETQALEERVTTIETSLSESTGGWEVHWYEMVAPGVFGAKIGTSSFPLNFAFDWGYGRVYQLWDRVGFKAYARIYLPRGSWCYVKVAANNCFALYVDGKKVLEHWGIDEALPAGEGELELWLAAGWHDLELHYYEWEETAWLSFYWK